MHFVKKKTSLLIWFFSCFAVKMKCSLFVSGRQDEVNWWSFQYFHTTPCFILKISIFNSRVLISAETYPKRAIETRQRFFLNENIETQISEIIQKTHWSSLKDK